MAMTLALGKIPSLGIIKPVDQRESRAIWSWLMVWVVLANLGFSLMYFIGSPPRITEIIMFGVIGLLVRGRNHILQCTAFLTLMVYAVLSFIAGLFNLTVTSLAQSFIFSMELDYGSSSEYMIAGATVLVLSIGACLFLRRPNGFSDLRLVLVAVAATMTMASIDAVAGAGMRGHYKRVAVAGAPFSSAVQQSGLIPLAGVPERNLMIVMVESLGAPAGNAEMSELLFAEYDAPGVQSQFQITRGETTYYNSTTAGEIRELCGRWGDYYDVVDRADSSCLPAKLAARGYETTAYHSFTGDFFQRNAWYPNIGFDHSVFGDELVRNGSRICGGVFPGACDRDVPRQLAAQLRAADKPQLVYWLTVNSHLPVPSGQNLDVDQCNRVSPALAAEFPMICRQFAIWEAIDQALIREITAPGFPPTDILLVGDHMPPYFDRHNRSQFAPDRVPWLLLRWRDGGAASGANVVRSSSGPPEA